jgi:hypothetical protein
MGTTRDVLDITAFDPMGLDITYIQETIREIPEDGFIDINNAERLATKFLRCADYTADLLSKAFHYFGYKSTEQRSAKSAAIYKKIYEKVTPTVAKEAYADDALYVKASNDQVTAEALTKWLEEKYQNLIKAHILCKTILSRYMPGERASSWQGNVAESDYETTSPSTPAVRSVPSFSKNTNREPGMKTGYVDGFEV